VHGTLKGKPVRKSLETRALAVADLKAKDMLQNRFPEPPAPHDGLHVVRAEGEGEMMTLESAQGKFLDAKKGKSAHTRELYETATTHFRRFAEAHSVVLLRQVKPDLIKAYFNEYGAQWKQRTKIGRLTHLRVWFNYAKEADWIVVSPAAKRFLTFSKPKTHARQPFTPEEVTFILAAIERLDEAIRDRARALILLLLYSGMRISDATFIERSAIKRDNILDFVVIKTKRPIALPMELNQRAVDALGALPASHVYFFQPDRVDDYADARRRLHKGEDGFAETLGSRYTEAIRETTALVKQVLTLAGLTGLCHRFRDTYAVNLLVGGTDIYTVSQALGHSDVKITSSHYLHLVPGYRERMAQKTRVLQYQFPLAG
jgi:integrase